MSKVLKPYTIIPPHLYVQRDADRQVQEIITDMGRPGYVLVSRQMGKTNLLLNAKRNFESEADVFVYVDLSNAFSNARQCFENIVNVALDAYSEKFVNSQEKIENLRLVLKDTPPHKQHTNELRLLLQELSGGKLVIILDEIDALTKTDYSDQIFSQIRSTYFASRVNYNEFYNLTYLLSGVVEPNEIIKDPKISPFNIGQKIYLNDFSLSEFDQFLNKAKLSLDEIVKERIYHLTNGNPRITWDICAEIEDIQNKVTTEDVDRIVTKLYLTTFDKPPIDNIRELVRNDREIRKAIIEIYYHKGSTISDHLKSKLYLAGIINYEEKDIKIKNEIIKKSLNLRWIESIEEEDKGLIRQALELYDKGDFEGALIAFEKFLEENEFDEHAKSSYYYYMGYSAYRNRDFTKSLNYLNKTKFEVEDDSKYYYTVLNLKGLVHFFRDEVEDAISHFKTVMASGRTDELYVRSLLNYCSCSIKLNEPQQVYEAKVVFHDIINGKSFDESRLKEGFVDEIKSIAYYNLAQIQKANDERNEAVENYYEAIKKAKLSVKPRFKLTLIESIDDKFQINQLLEEIVYYAIDNETVIPDFDPENPVDFSLDELKEVAIKTFLSNDDLFDLLIPKLESYYQQGLPRFLYEIGLNLINQNQDWDTAIPFFEKFRNKANSDFRYKASDDIHYGTLKILAYTENANGTLALHKQYIDLFLANRSDNIDVVDLEISFSLIQGLSAQQHHIEALNYSQMIYAVRELTPKNIWINFLAILHLELNIYSQLNDRSNMTRRANEILSLIGDSNIQKQRSNILGETGLEFIRSNAETILRPRLLYNPQVEILQTPNRNDVVRVKYQNGTVVQTKFKKVEKDILLKKCFIINNA